MLKPLGLGVDQLYDGAGKAIALQVKVTTSPLEASCDSGLVVISGLTTYGKNKHKSLISLLIQDRYKDIM